MSGRVRQAGIRELDRLAAMWTAITYFHEPFDPLFRLRSDSEGELNELLRALARDPDALVLVYDEEGDLPGFCIARLDFSPPIMEETSRGQITDLGVREDARRRGIATELVNEALAWVQAAGVHRVEVHVAKQNEVGQAFWRARGFGDLMDVLHKRL